MIDTRAKEVLEQYEEDKARWKEHGRSYKDIVPLSTNEVLFIKASLHPTEKKESKLVTEKIIKFICERRIVTAQEIYDELGLSDKPVLKRLKVFRQFSLVRRESRKYYLPTPRMDELYKRHLRRICR